MSKRFKSVVCTDILLKKEKSGKNYILLMKRQNTGYDDGKYELPGGHLEQGEDLYDALIREIKEELCIDVRREDISIIHLMHHYTGERLNFIFEVNGEKIEPKIGEPEKCSELRWVDINKLPNETTDKVKKIVKNIKANIFYDKL